MEITKDKKLQPILEAYGIPWIEARFTPFGNGHINETYLVKWPGKGEEQALIFQRINSYVFKEPWKVMENIRGVTSHLREKIQQSGGDVFRETLQLVSRPDGGDYYQDEDGEYWRAYHYIHNGEAFEVARGPEDLYQAGLVFGRFQRHLDDYPMDTLWDTIPDFHNTKVRLKAFYQAVENNRSGRRNQVEREIQWVQSHQEEMETLVNLLEEGKLPLRVTHNDTKLNNVLMDRITGKGMCATDLDTVMPGLSLYDFGDAIRFGTNSSTEDESDQTKVEMRIELYEAYCRGYLEEAGTILTPLEKELLPLGAKVITL
ncbi:MAG TPA: aminoglycoside phosphotransferase family protein, partial [Bacillota bacterium]|nr:aminoglycoside phosphotransferase family protein [Bacillota bacterium]